MNYSTQNYVIVRLISYFLFNTIVVYGMESEIYQLRYIAFYKTLATKIYLIFLILYKVFLLDWD